MYLPCAEMINMHNTTPLRSLVLLLLAVPSLLFSQTTTFYAVHSPDGPGGMLATVDISTGAETNPLSIMLNGDQVDGFTTTARL